jgi:phage-related protein
MADDTYVQEIQYKADISDIQRKLQTLGTEQGKLDTSTGSSTGRMSSSWDKLGPKVRNVGLFLGGVGGIAAVMAPRMLNAGAGFEAIDAKSKTVFEGSLGSVEKWASTNASSMGMTQTQAIAAAASFADLMKPMGFTAEQAAKMATETTNLSGALSAWTGGTRSAAEVNDILSKAMLGERDGLKELGISISEADVQARLAKNGQQDLTGAALEQAKALATQQLINEKSTDAQKAWADGSMDAIKQQNKMKTATAQAGESVTKALYPALQALVPMVSSVATWVGERAPGAIATFRRVIGNVVDFFVDNKPILIAAAIGLGAVLVGLFTAWTVGAASAAAATLVAAAPFIAVGAAVAAVAAAVLYAYQNWEWFRTAVDAVKEFIVNQLVPAFQQVWGFIDRNVIPIIKKLIEMYLKVLITYFTTVKNVIVNMVIPALVSIATTIATVATAVGNAVSSIVGFVTGIPSRISKTVSTLWDGLRSGITSAKDWVSAKIDQVVGFVTGIPGRISGVVMYLWTPIRTGITKARDWIGNRIDDIVNFVTELPGRVGNTLSNLWNGLKDGFRTVIQWIIDRWNDLYLPIPEVDLGPLGKIGGGRVYFPEIKIPGLHTGGKVPGPTGSEALYMLQAGETVRTRAQEADVQRRLNGPDTGRSVVIHGDLVVQSNEPARHWFDEGMWRVAG